MEKLVGLVMARIDHEALEKLMVQLRQMDQEMDISLDELKEIRQDITFWDRINVFTDSDAEKALGQQNQRFAEIKRGHAQIIAAIKSLIESAILSDFGLALKIQTGDTAEAARALRVEHQWGSTTKVYGYRIRGLEGLMQNIDGLEQLVNTRFGFLPGVVNLHDLLHAVYDEVLRQGGFIDA